MVKKSMAQLCSGHVQPFLVQVKRHVFHCESQTLFKKMDSLAAGLCLFFKHRFLEALASFQTATWVLGTNVDE